MLVRSRRHLAVVALFMVFGFAAIVPEVFFAGKTSAPSLMTIASPGTCFVPAMILAGVLVLRVGLVPRGISFSPGRTAGAVVLGFFSYPVGYLAITVGMLVLFGVAMSSPDAPAGAQSTWLQFLGGFALLVGILFAGGMVTGLIVTAGFTLATLVWPRRAFLYLALLTATSILGGVFAAIVRSKILFPTEPVSYLVSGHSLDLLIEHAGNIPLIVMVGQPLLAGLIGHWLYLAADGANTMSARSAPDRRREVRNHASAGCVLSFR